MPKPTRLFTARLRQAARRRLSRFTNAGRVRALAEVTEATAPRFAGAAAFTGPRPPIEPRFIPGPPGLAEHALAVPAALLGGGLPEPNAMGRVAEAAARLTALVDGSAKSQISPGGSLTAARAVWRAENGR